MSMSKNILTPVTAKISANIINRRLERLYRVPGKELKVPPEVTAAERVIEKWIAKRRTAQKAVEASWAKRKREVQNHVVLGNYEKALQLLVKLEQEKGL
jgi:hypothetical protein